MLFEPITRTALAMLLGFALLGPAGTARAQDPEEEGSNQPLVVRGHYEAGELRADWEAMVEGGKPVRIAEWRRYGEHGDASVVFDFHQGDLMHYGERGRRVAGQAGVADGYRKISLNLNFSQGRYASGRKQVDGIDTEPDEQEIQAAQAQAQAALQRLAGTRSAWGESGKVATGTVGFSRHGGPASPKPPVDRTRPGEVAFRCSEGLRVVLGAGTGRQADSLIVEQEGKPPVPLLRQPPSGRYEYLGQGWAATRFAETIRLDSAGGQAWDCNVVAAVPAAGSVPAGNPVAPAGTSQSDALPSIEVPSKR
jgi:hypothetical protein